MTSRLELYPSFKSVIIAVINVALILSVDVDDGVTVCVWLF